VGAVGTDLRSIGHHLKDELHRVGYKADIIRLSDLMLDTDRFAELRGLSKGPEDERINRLMDAGDEFRGAAQRGDAVALLAIGKVGSIREGLTGSGEIPARHHAYIFHSLKHPDEVTTLRNVYGQAFFVLCAYSPRETRALSLSDRISRSRREYSVSIKRDPYDPKLAERHSRKSFKICAIEKRVSREFRLCIARHGSTIASVRKSSLW
jgi:hypothetical protein